MNKLALVVVLLALTLVTLVSATRAERPANGDLTSRFFPPVPASAPTPPREQTRHIEDTFAQINIEGEPIERGREDCRSKEADLAAEEKRLIDTADLLKGAVRHFQEDNQKAVADAQAQNAAADRHNANRCTYPEGRPEVCAAYAEEARQLRAWGERVDATRSTLEFRRKGLLERRDDLSRVTLDWARRQKENDARIEDLNAKEAELVGKWRRKLGLPSDIRTLQDLKRIGPACEGAIRACVDARGLAKRCSDEELETMKYCTNIQWDGDRPGRPPLGIRRR